MVINGSQANGETGLNICINGYILFMKCHINYRNSYIILPNISPKWGSGVFPIRPNELVVVPHETHILSKLEFNAGPRLVAWPRLFFEVWLIVKCIPQGLFFDVSGITFLLKSM